MNKVISKISIFFIALILITGFSLNTAYAVTEGTEGECANPPAWKKGYCTFVGNVNSFKTVNIRRTIADASVTMLIDVPSHLTYGRSFDQMQGCVSNVMGTGAPTAPGDDCSDLQTASIITGANGYPTQYRVSGSIMGLAMALEDVALNDQVPINLAYYAKYQAAKIPVLKNTAFAATPDANGDILLKVTLEIWEKIRDVSFGLLAIFMLVIGIMIMLRHKVNPQTVVSVQSAIPRIILSIIFIAFSYPIGALAISLVMPLSGLSLSLFGPALAGAPPLATIMYFLASLPVLFIAGTGPAMIILTLILFLVFLFYLAKFLITIVMTYVHLIYAILSAPPLFAWAAIPGNEEVITDWFKRLGVKVITIPIMVFGLRLVWFMAWEVANAATAQSPTSVGLIPIAAGGGILIVGIPLMIIMLLVQLGKVPKMLDELVLGKKK